MTKDDPFERKDVFRPRMGRRGQPRQERIPTTFRGQVLSALRRNGFGSLGVARAHQGRARRGTIAVRPPSARSRRCVIKARYVKVTPGSYKAAKLHLAYLEREGVERDGSAGKLYGADEGFDAQTFRTPMEGEQRQFRFIVSPEDGERLDLKEFARGFMHQVEKDTGRSLIWTAVNHYNTDNPHVHIVVRGVDRDGHDVRIDGRYIGQEMRWRAQEVLTRELGPRSDLEMDRQRAVYVGREALTPIDRVLAHYQSAEGKVTLERLATAQPTERVACLGRLSTLERLGLATREGPAQWHLSTGWERELDKLGEWAEIANRVYRAIPSSAGQYEHVEPGRAIASIRGNRPRRSACTTSRAASCTRSSKYRRDIRDTSRCRRMSRRRSGSGTRWRSGARPIDGSSRATSGSSGSRRGTMASTIRPRISERSRRVVGVLRRADPHRPSWSRRTSAGWSAWNGTDWPNAKRMDAGACRRI